MHRGLFARSSLCALALLLPIVACHTEPEPARTSLRNQLLPMLPSEGHVFRYDAEYPFIPYSTAIPTDPFARLWERLERGEATLDYDEDGTGYLGSLLRGLGVPVESQALVFTRTSLQRGLISPMTPRAIYFGDEVYVAWLQGTDMIEISALDPLLGTVFYTLSQDRGNPPQIERQTALCLQCHDTSGLTAPGGIPELVMGSMLPNDRGEAVTHEAWFDTTHETPLRHRWGGWYVTGTHGAQVHLGNVYVRNVQEAIDLDLSKTGNVTDLAELIDPTPYLGAHSDLVALMVFEHQVFVQNRIIALNYRVRGALHEEGLGPDTGGPVSAATAAVIEEHGEALLRTMLFAAEAPLQSPVRGSSDYAETFAALGPRARDGRSLRDLDLQRRMFKYPLSYLVYSEAFDALPEVAKAYLARRLDEVLSGQDTRADFAHLSAEDRRAVREILVDTKPEMTQGWR